MLVQHYTFHTTLVTCNSYIRLYVYKHLHVAIAKAILSCEQKSRWLAIATSSFVIIIAIDLIPDLIYYRLFPCHTHHFDGQISIAFNGINGNGSLFCVMHEP